MSDENSANDTLDPQTDRSQKKRNRALTAFLVTTAIFASLFIAAALQDVDAAGPDNQIDDPGLARSIELHSLVIYWGLTIALILIVTYRKRYRNQIILCAFSLVVSLGLAEFFLRRLEVVRAMPPHYGLSSARIHHVYPPNLAMFSGYIDDVPIVVETNEDGLRSKYSREEFRRFGIRIATLGDSFTFGMHILQDRTFPMLLEAYLRESLGTDDIAVLNAGINSYSPFLEKLQFNEIVKDYKPTLVIVALDAGDIGDDYRYMNMAHHESGTPRFISNRGRDGLLLPRLALPTAPRPFGRHVGLLQVMANNDFARKRMLLPGEYPFRVLRQLLQREGGAVYGDTYYFFELKIAGVLESNRFFIYRYPLNMTEKYFQATLDNIQEIADSANSIGANLLLLVTPRYHHWNPAECPDDWERLGYSRYTLHEQYQYEYFRFFDERAGQVDFPIYNMLPDFQKTNLFPLVFRHDVHWNPRGHEFVAETLANHLIANDLVKPPNANR
jgi:hypothetical protein